MDATLIQRLRGFYPIGPAAAGGWRDMRGTPVPAAAIIPLPIHLEAADAIEELLRRCGAQTAPTPADEGPPLGIDSEGGTPD